MNVNTVRCGCWNIVIDEWISIIGKVNLLMYFENNVVLTTLVLFFKISFSSASSSMQLSAIIVSVHLWYTTFSNHSKNNMEIKWQQSQE